MPETPWYTTPTPPRVREHLHAVAHLGACSALALLALLLAARPATSGPLGTPPPPSEPPAVPLAGHVDTAAVRRSSGLDVRQDTVRVAGRPMLRLVVRTHVDGVEKPDTLYLSLSEVTP